MAILNHKWRTLISKHYTWSCLPELGSYYSISRFADFLNEFSEFTDVHIPDFHGSLLSSERIAQLKTATSIGIKNITEI